MRRYRAGRAIRSQNSRKQKKQPHEEGLETALPQNERNLLSERRFVCACDVPSAHMAVGHTGVHVDYEHDHEQAQVINPEHPGDRRHLNRF